MCIICNVSEIGPSAADEFLGEFSAASRHMRAATQKMLQVVEITPDAERRKQYKAIHKRMVRQLREWNRLEHLREIEPTSTEGSP